MGRCPLPCRGHRSLLPAEEGAGAEVQDSDRLPRELYFTALSTTGETGKGRQKQGFANWLQVESRYLLSIGCFNLPWPGPNFVLGLSGVSAMSSIQRIFSLVWILLVLIPANWCSHATAQTTGLDEFKLLPQLGVAAIGGAAISHNGRFVVTVHQNGELESTVVPVVLRRSAALVSEPRFTRFRVLPVLTEDSEAGPRNWPGELLFWPASAAFFICCLANCRLPRMIASFGVWARACWNSLMAPAYFFD